jgi:hypothetical protein
MLWLGIVAALAVGYALGRAQLGQRASQWAAWQLIGERPTGPRLWLGHTVRSAENLGWLLAHPVKGVHAWKHRNDPPPPRSPAPVIDPDWVAKRAARDGDTS